MHVVWNRAGLIRRGKELTRFRIRVRERSGFRLTCSMSMNLQIGKFQLDRSVFDALFVIVGPSFTRELRLSYNAAG